MWRRTGSNAYAYLTTVGNPLSYVDAGLTNGLRYDYALTGYNAIGGGGYWAYASAASGPPGLAPANFSATPGNAQVSLSWSPVFGATFYNLWRKKSTDTGWLTPFNVTGTSYLDTGLTNGVLYNYSVNAGNANGSSTLFSSADATPLSSFPLPTPLASYKYLITTSTNPYAEPVSSFSLAAPRLYDNLVGDSATDYRLTSTSGYPCMVVALIDLGPTPPLVSKIEFAARQFPSNAVLGGSYASSNDGFVAGPQGYATLIPINSGTTSITSVRARYWQLKVATYPGAPSSVGYGAILSDFRLYDGAGVLIGTSTAPVLAPSAPSGLVASSRSSGVVDLAWNTVAGATSYDVLRSTTSGGSYLVKATVSTNSWSDTTVTNGTTYYYVVVAKNNIGPSAYSNQDSITPLAAPTGLSAIPGTQTCYLSWNPVVGATSYIVQRKYQPSTGGLPQTNRFSTTATNYRDQFPPQGFIYYNYSVQAVNSKANGDYAGIGVYPTTVDSDLNTLSLSPATVQGGSSVTGTVTLTNPPQSGDAVISLSSDNAAAIVPASVTIIGGTTSATFTVSTTAVTTQQTATITASYAGVTRSATLTINVAPPPNRAPVANAQSVSADEDTAKAIALTATDADNDPLTYSIVTPPSKGTLSGTAPNLTYTPNLNANGSDSFAFKANDGKVDSNIATVSITVNPVNDAPVATAQNISTTKNTAKSGTLTATDVDSSTLTFSKVNDPSHGTVTIASSGAFTYTPATDYTGGDSFTFKANDGALDSNSAIVSITVNASTPPAVTLSSFTLAPTSVVGGATSTATVTLSGAAPADIVVNLSSDNTAAQVPVPASVTIAVGASSTQFNVRTSAVTATAIANISATYNGLTQTKPLTITAPDPNTPNGLEAVSTGSGKMTIYWDQVAGATGYNVYRGTSAGMENYSAPVNGATLVNSPSYVGSGTQMFTDTGLTNGTEYFYTVKAVVNGVESAASNEDSDIVDPNSVPWDTRDPQQILGVAMSLANSSIPDGEDPINTADEFSVSGPDGAVYDNSISTQQPPSGTISADGRSCLLPDGTTVSLPSVDWDASAGTTSLSSSSISTLGNYHTMSIPDGLGHPYRGIRTEPGYNAAGFYVDLGPVSISALGMGKPYYDHAFVCLGTHAYMPTYVHKIQDSCDAGLISSGGLWKAYILKSGGRWLYDGPKVNPTRHNNFMIGSANKKTFKTSDRVHMHMWIAGSTLYTYRRHACSFIRITDAFDPAAPALAFGMTLEMLKMDGSNGIMYRLQQIADKPAYYPTRSTMTGFNWISGTLTHAGERGYHNWGALPTDMSNGLTRAVSRGPGTVTVASDITPNQDANVSIITD